MSDTRTITREQLRQAMNMIGYERNVKAIWNALPQPAPAADGEPRTANPHVERIAHLQRPYCSCGRPWPCPMAAQPAPGLDVDVLAEANRVVLARRGRGASIPPHIWKEIAAEYARLRGGA
jgi:hypothetical protein